VADIAVGYDCGRAEGWPPDSVWSTELIGLNGAGKLCAAGKLYNFDSQLARKTLTGLFPQAASIGSYRAKSSNHAMGLLEASPVWRPTALVVCGNTR